MSGQIGSVEFEREGTTLIASVAGEVDMSSAGDVRRRILDAVANEDEALILDLSRLSFIDSAGLRVVFELAGLMEERSKQVHLAVPPDIFPRRAITLVGLDDVVPIHPDRATALAATRPSSV